MSAALIVIDVQRALFETSPPPADADAVLERINALADRARRRRAGHLRPARNPRRAMAAGQPGVDLDLRLTPAPGDRRVRKTTPDSFLRTTLSDELEAAGASRLVICGYATEFCVDTTAPRGRAGLSRDAGGRRPHHPRQAACSRRPHPRAPQCHAAGDQQFRRADPGAAGRRHRFPGRGWGLMDPELLSLLVTRTMPFGKYQAG